MYFTLERLRVIFSRDDLDSEKSFSFLKKMALNDPMFAGLDLSKLSLDFWNNLKSKNSSYFSNQSTIISNDIKNLKEALASARISFSRAPEVADLLKIPMFDNILTSLSVPESQFYAYLKNVLEQEIGDFVSIGTRKSPALPILAKDKQLPVLDFLYYLYMGLFPSAGTSSGNPAKDAMQDSMPYSWKKINEKLEYRSKQDQLKLLKILKKKNDTKIWLNLVKLLVVLLIVIGLAVWIVSSLLLAN